MTYLTESGPDSLEVKEAMGAWLEEMAAWEWFVTLTFRDRAPSSNWTKPGWQLAKTAWQVFLAAAQPGLGSLTWVRGFELQRWRGVPHIHALVAGVDTTARRMDLVDKMGRMFGWCRVLLYDPEKGARYYLIKYVTKELSDLAFSDNCGRQA